MSVEPADYPPPFSWREVIAEPSDPPDERIDVGVLIVGAGPAGLACAIRLGQLLEREPAIGESLGISHKTVGHHVQHVYEKAGVRSRAAATLWAFEQDLVLSA